MLEYFWPTVFTALFIWFIWAVYKDWKKVKAEKAKEKESWVITVDGYGKYRIKYFPVDFMGWGITVPGEYDSVELAERGIEKIKEDRIKSVRKYVKTVG